MIRRALLVFPIAWAAVGCLPDEPAGATVPYETCASGLVWAHGDKGSSRMYPGRDCNQCHIDRGAGPVYGASGTVFARPLEPDDCYGVDGAVVELRDSAGQSLQLTSNNAGNFYAAKSKTQLAMPYLANVYANGRVISGSTPHTQLNCGACHTPSQAGRIVSP